MTEAADERVPEPGWWIVTEDATGRTEMLKRIGRDWCSGCDWESLGPMIRPTLPPGWTIGPSVADSLRDAARLREIVNIIVPEAGGFDPENEQQIEDIALEWSHRYYAAKRDAERYQWCRKHDAILIAEEFLDAEMARERKPEGGE